MVMLESDIQTYNIFNIKSQPNLDFDGYCTYVYFAPYSIIYDNITFSSLTKEELGELIIYYKKIKNNLQTIASQAFLKTLQENNLYITNVKPKMMNFPNSPFYMGNIIYFDKNFYQEDPKTILFHEGEHFIDCYLNNNNLYEKEKASIAKIRSKLTIKQVNEFLFDYQCERKYWEDKYSTEGYTDKIEKLVNGKLFENGYNAVFDIFDGLTRGTLQERMNYKRAGHGKLFLNDRVACGEILAEISVLYNLGNLDLLLAYFPSKTVQELVNLYEESFQLNQMKNLFLRKTQVIPTITDLFIEEYRKGDLSQTKMIFGRMPLERIITILTSYEISSYYLEGKSNDLNYKLNCGSLINQLVDYELSRDISLFQDENLKTYISLLDGSQISMFLQGNIAEPEEKKLLQKAKTLLKRN